MNMHQAVVDAFGTDLALTLRSPVIAGKLKLPHRRVVDMMLDLITEGRLVGARVIKGNHDDEVEARLALAANKGAAPVPASAPKPTAPGNPQAHTKRARILAVLTAAKEPLHSRQVAHAVGETYASTAYLLMMLGKDGTVVRHNYGRWATWSVAGVVHAEAAAIATMPSARPRAESRKTTLPVEREDRVSDLRVAQVKEDELIVGLFSDGHLELAVGDERMRLRPQNTQTLFNFLDKFSGLAEDAAT